MLRTWEQPQRNIGRESYYRLNCQTSCCIVCNSGPRLWRCPVGSTNIPRTSISSVSTLSLQAPNLTTPMPSRRGTLMLQPTLFFTTLNPMISRAGCNRLGSHLFKANSTFKIPCKSSRECSSSMGTSEMVLILPYS
jgi:hypothetical protein